MTGRGPRTRAMTGAGGWRALAGASRKPSYYAGVAATTPDADTGKHRGGWREGVREAATLGITSVVVIGRRVRRSVNCALTLALAASRVPAPAANSIGMGGLGYAAQGP